MSSFHEELEQVLQSHRHKGDWYTRILQAVKDLPNSKTGNTSGTNGWSPLFSLVKSDDRILLQISDWINGTGTKPIVGGYISELGLTNNKSLAVNIKGNSGKDGKSAYEIAVENGFDGDEAQWIKNLKGNDGKSAYQIALENGFIGTEKEWLASFNSNSVSGIFQVDVEDGNLYFIADDNVANPLEYDEESGNLYYIA